MLREKVKPPVDVKDPMGGQDSGASGDNCLLRMIPHPQGDCQPPHTPAAIWRAIVKQIELTRPDLVAVHDLQAAHVTQAGDVLRVQLARLGSAGWMTHRYAETSTRPVERAAALAGVPGLRVEFVAAGAAEVAA